MLCFLSCSPSPTKKAKMKAETLDGRKEYEKTKSGQGFWKTCVYHIIIAQQKSAIIRVGNEDHEVTCFVQFVVKLEV